MSNILRPLAVVFSSLTFLTGVVYPLGVTALSNVIFPDQSQGSLVVRDGKIVGSRLIGQSWTSPKYFWGRPSMTSAGPYDGALSSGSNQGPSNPALIRAVADRVAALHAADPTNTASIPVDLVTASASGLDPDVSPAAAYYQVGRVARSRGVSEERVRQLVASHIEGRSFGVLGEARVNVLRLNLALEELGAPGS